MNRESQGDPNAEFFPINTQQAQSFQSNTFLGTRCPEIKPPNTFRLYSGNHNGFNLGDDGGEFCEYLEEMKRFGCDVFCAQEIKVDTLKSAVKEKLYSATRNIFDHSRAVFSSSKVMSKNEFKPGGTSIIAQGNITGRVLETHSDDLGRWSSFTLSCKGDRNLTVISAYQPCDQPIQSQGRIRTLTVTVQQDRELRMQNRSLTPRQSFVYDLQQFAMICKDLQQCRKDFTRNEE